MKVFNITDVCICLLMIQFQKQTNTVLCIASYADALLKFKHFSLLNNARYLIV